MVRKRNIIVYIAATADGFISRSDGSVDWLERPRPKSIRYGVRFSKERREGVGLRYKSSELCLHAQSAIGSAGGRGVRERINQSIRNPSAGRISN
jgi:hypothetical protein